MGIIKIEMNENDEYLMKYEQGFRTYVVFKHFFKSVMFQPTANRWEFTEASLNGEIYIMDENGDIVNKKTGNITTNETILDMIDEMIQDCYTQFMELKFINPMYDLASNKRKIEERNKKENI